MNKTFSKAVLTTVFSFASLSATAAQTILDFENPIPGNLAPQSYIQGSDIPTSQLLIDKYINLGISFSGATIANFGLGHAASGSNALSAVNMSNNTVDYASPVNYSFFMPNTNGGQLAVTDYFAYSPDLAGFSGNVVTISGYGVDGSLLGQAQYTETGTFTSPLTLTGIVIFHSVTVTQTLYYTASGGIGQDLVTFGTLTPAVPEADTSAMLLIGLGVIGFMVRRKNTQA
jgi:hypothetical protein